MTRSLRTVALLLALTLASHSRAQGWTRTGGGEDADQAQSIAAMPDGGTIVSGVSESLGGAWIVRFDAAGAVAWQRLITPVTTTMPVLVVAMPDGGAVVAGTVDRSGPRSPWLARLSAGGDIEWQHAYDLGRGSGVTALASTADGFVLAGFGTSSFHWVLAVDSTGNVIRCDDLSPAGSAMAFTPDSVVATPDGGVVVSGSTSGVADVLRLDSAGNVVTSATLGFSCGSVDSVRTVLLQDGSFLVYGTQSCGEASPFVARLDPALSPTIATSLRAPAFSTGARLHSLVAAPGGFIGAGDTGPLGGALLVKLDAALMPAWQRVHSGAGASLASVVALPAGDIAAAGAWQDDFLAMRVDASGLLGESCGTVADASLDASRILATLTPVDDVTTAPVSVTVLAWDAVAVASTTTFAVLGDRHEPDSCESPTRLEPNRPLTADFCDEADDWFEMVACEGSSFTLTTDVLGPLADTVVDVLPWDCSTVLASDDDSGGARSSRLAWTSPVDGRMRVRVRQKDGTSGPDRSFRLSLAANDPGCATWLRTFTDGAYLRPTGLAALADGTILVTSYHDDGRSSPTGEDPLLLRVASSGELLDVEKLVGPGVDSARDAAAISVGGSVVAGSCQVASRGVAFLRATDATGDVAWERAYDRDTSGDFYSVVALRDGGFLAVGKHYSGGLNAWIVRVGATGDVVWDLALGAQGSPIEAIDALEGDDGSLVVVSRMYLLGVTALTVLEPSGVVRSHRRYDLPPDADASPRPGGGLLVSAGGRLASLAPDGSVDWCKRYWSRSGGTTRPRAVRAISDGGSLVVGSASPRVGVAEQPFVMRLDATGAIEWSGCLEGSGGFVALEPTSDGGFVACGEILGPEGRTCGFVLRMDASGRLSSRCLLPFAPVTVTAMTLAATDAAADVVPGSITVQPFHFDSEGRPITTEVACAGSGSSPPDEVSPRVSSEPLVFVGHDTLRWETGWPSRSWSFDLYRGSLRDLRLGSPMGCLAADLASSSAVDAERPPLGECWTYVVTGVNGAGEGTMGFDSFGAERVNAAPCP